MKAKDRLIFALDYPGLEEAKKAVQVLSDHVGLFKVGLELFVSAGPVIFKMIAENADAGIFLDLKFHDIPETVRAAVAAAARYHVRFITVHASEGIMPLKTATYNIQKDTKILAVTILTSSSQRDLQEAGMDRSLGLMDLVLLRARQAREAGCSGVICSGAEVRRIKEQLGTDLIAVVPGIRPEWAGVRNDDQNRVTTPRQAILDGADFIVVGRPIRTARAPLLAAQKIVEEIDAAARDLSAPS
jgi:orotidine-5'-phosphate decarboxylase